MELCVLASGSSGNCSVIRTNNGVFLIDCGLGPRVTAQRLNGTGVTMNQIQSICVTHLDRDHFNIAEQISGPLACRRLRLREPGAHPEVTRCRFWRRSGLYRLQPRSACADEGARGGISRCSIKGQSKWKT